jgi:hypothetical protein
MLRFRPSPHSSSSVAPAPYYPCIDMNRLKAWRFADIIAAERLLYAHGHSVPMRCKFSPGAGRAGIIWSRPVI